MRRSLLSLPLGLALALLSVGLVNQACSSSDDADSGGGGDGSGASSGKSSGGSGKNGSGSGGGANIPDGGLVLETGPDPEAYFADDPPPPSCSGGPANTPVITGTLECPSDKNREGCPCEKPGSEAPCWPGFRKNRNRGICKDGVTKCQVSGETDAVWGKCEGYVLPKENATASKDRCLCFSGGQWKLNNLSPCFVSDQNKKVIGAVSTIETAPGQSKCPAIMGGKLVAPAEPFSTTSLTVDCAGHFKLCYTLRAGKAESASPSDCIMAQVCSEADYGKADVSQPFPSLPSWATTTPEQVACAEKFATSGGYGEMTVVGVSVECDKVEEHIFNRVNYCPLSCTQNPSDPACAGCMNGGSGSF